MDGRWALLVPPLRDEPEAQLQLVDMESGAVRPVELPSGIRDFQGDRRRAVCVHGFVTGGTGIAVSSLATFAVYNLGQSAWVSYTMPSPEFAVYTGQPPPISPDGRRVFQVFRGGSVALKELPAAGQHAGSGWRALVRMPERRDPAETYAVVLDLQNGQMTKVPLAEFEHGPAFNPTAAWFGNDHLLVLSASGLCLYDLDGSREVLYP